MEAIIKYIPLFIAFLSIICFVLIIYAGKLESRIRKDLKVKESKIKRSWIIPKELSDDDITNEIKSLVSALNQSIIEAAWRDLEVELTVSSLWDGVSSKIQADIFKRVKKYEKQIEELTKKIEELQKGIKI